MHPHLLFLNDSYAASVYLDANIFIVDSFICERAIELINKDVAIALVNHLIDTAAFRSWKPFSYVN